MILQLDKETKIVLLKALQRGRLDTHDLHIEDNGVSFAELLAEARTIRGKRGELAELASDAVYSSKLDDAELDDIVSGFIHIIKNQKENGN